MKKYFKRITYSSNQDFQKVFPDIPVVGFRNGKSLKIHLVRAKLPNLEIKERSESCRKDKFLVCEFIRDTDTTKAMVKHLKFEWDKWDT